MPSVLSTPTHTQIHSNTSLALPATGRQTSLELTRCSSMGGERGLVELVVLGRPTSGRTLEAEHRNPHSIVRACRGAHGKGAVISGIDVHSIGLCLDPSQEAFTRGIQSYSRLLKQA